MRPTRRSVLAGLGALGLSSPLQARAQTPGAALFAMVHHYARMGVHHTGGAADRQTSDWQEQWLAGHGFDTSRHAVQVTGPVYQHCHLQADGLTIEAAAQWPSPPNLASLRGKAGAEFAVTTVSGNTIDTTDNLAALNQAFAQSPQAVLAICSHPSGKIQFGNVSDTLPPFPVPVILVGRADQTRLQRANQLSLSLAGRIQTRTGESILGVHRQSGAKDWLIVSTPQSGWTRCGGERGPGIALFRSLAAQLAQSGAPTHLCFVSTSGHEFHNLGARLLHESGVLPSPDETRAWLHIGAGLANRAYTKDPDAFAVHDSLGQGYAMMPQAYKATLRDLLAPARIRSVSFDEFLVGEIKEVVELGYDRAIGLVAEHPKHHVPGDDETMTSPALLALYDQAVKTLTAQLIRS